MRYLLCGSYAYDTILLHAGRFETRILPEAIARLNVSFGVDSVRDEFGGTAGNIAYNAARIHDDPTLGTQPVWPVLAGTLGGADAVRYLERLGALGLETSTLTIVPDARCAHAWILTDSENNQITAFSTGAMESGTPVPDVQVPLWHLAPEAPRTMMRFAAAAVANDVPFFFDPGQALPALLQGAGAEVIPLAAVLEAATGIFVNDYEAALLQAHTGRTPDSWLVRPGQFLVRTLGGDGVELHETDAVVRVPVARASRVCDPTGCGDAFRAGFIHGWLNGWRAEACARLGAAMGSLAVETSGGQNHRVVPGSLSERMSERPRRG